jgi:hypothetical protein
MEISERLGVKSFWPWSAAAYAWSLCTEGQLSKGFELFERAFQVAVEANVGGYPVVGIAPALLADG